MLGTNAKASIQKSIFITREIKSERRADIKVQFLFHSPFQKCDKNNMLHLVSVYKVICNHWHIVQSSVDSC